MDSDVQLRCHPRRLTVSQNYKARHQQPSCCFECDSNERDVLAQVSSLALDRYPSPIPLLLLIVSDYHPVERWCKSYTQLTDCAMLVSTYGVRELSIYESTTAQCRLRTARLTWEREHRDWSAQDWKRVAWSDKSRFRLLSTDGRLRI
ncbi:hypothetical protein TNCV_2434381 [Trichonephila clavipes]|nr:hypothetical protein TNCV_2434381 [Trichonephila clavipes]